MLSEADSLSDVSGEPDMSSSDSMESLLTTTAWSTSLFLKKSKDNGFFEIVNLNYRLNGEF